MLFLHVLALSDACALPAHCATSPSIIAISEGGMGKAGLTDRLAVLTTIANLAASLCARVYAPPPCMLLSERHNRGARLPCSVRWSRYLNLTRASDGAPMLVPRAALASKLYAQPFLEINGTSLKKSRGGHQKFLHHGPNISQEVLRKYLVAKAAATQGRPFVWHLEEYYYDWWGKVGVAAGGSTGGAEPFIRCRFVRTSEPHIIQWVIPRFEAAVGGVPLSSMALLHVRRGTVGEISGRCCDTSSQGLAHALSCNGRLRALAPAGTTSRSVVSGVARASEEPSKRAQRVLIFTDEHDRAYIDDLTRQLGDLAGSHTVHSGDTVLDSLLRSHPDANQSILAASGAPDAIAGARAGARAGAIAGASHVDNFLVYLSFLGIQRRVAATYRLGLFGLCFCGPEGAQQTAAASDFGGNLTWGCARRFVFSQSSHSLSVKELLADGKGMFDQFDLYHTCLDISSSSVHGAVGSKSTRRGASAGCHLPLIPIEELTGQPSYATSRICPSPGGCE